MSNVTIPLNAHINTADDLLIHQIDSETKDCMYKKNTLQFKKALSPLWKKYSNSALYTTGGHTINRTSQSRFTDEQGRTYDVDPSFRLYDTVDISNIFSGKCTSAWKDASGKVYSTWKTDKEVNFITYDINTKEITLNYAITPSDVSYINIKLVSKCSDIFTVVIVYNNRTSEIRAYRYGVTNTCELLKTLTVNSILGTDLYTYSTRSGSTYDIYVGLDDLDVRKRMTYKWTYNRSNPTSGSIEAFVAGFGCIGYNGLITGEPLPFRLDDTWTGSNTYDIGRITPWVSLPDYYTFLDNGIGAMYNLSSTITNAELVESNKALEENSAYTFNDEGGHYSANVTWGGKNHQRTDVIFINGWSIEDGKALVLDGFTPSNTTQTTQRYFNTDFDDWQVPIEDIEYFSWTGRDTLQVDLSDGFGNTSWNSVMEPTIQNGCNPFPYCWTIFNRVSSKGKYWDYGPGWSKAYLRDFYIGGFNYSGDNYKRTIYEVFPLSIISFGINSTNSKVVTPLDPANFILDENIATNFDIVPSETKPYAYSKAWYCRSPTWTETHPPYVRIHTWNDEVYKSGMVWTDFIGADNLPNHTVLDTIPFCVNIDSAFDIREQYFNDNYMSTSSKGTLINSASIKDTNPPFYHQATDNVLNMFDNGTIYRISKSVLIGSTTLEKMADYLYRTNTLIGNNLFVDSKDSFYGIKGFRAFNGTEVINLHDFSEFSCPSDNTNTDGNSVYYSASGYNVNMTDYEDRSTSYLLPAFQLPLIINSEEVENFTFQLVDNKKELTKPILAGFFEANEEVDHFYNHSLNSTSIEYQTTKKLPYSPANDEEVTYGIETYDKDKEGQVWWITSDIQIFPLGIGTKITGKNYLNSTVELGDNYTVRLYRNNNTTFVNFNPNTSVYKGSTIFTIYGYNYSFDGQAIYYLGSGDDTTQMSFACYALGMKFLANSGTEAYFYSTFEKRIYLFTGSVTLQAADLLSREGNIIDSLYSSLEQTLYLLTDEGNLIARTQNDMMMIPVGTDYSLEGTDTGLVLSGDWKYLRYRLYKTDETVFESLEYETEYLGKNDSLFKVSSIDITLFRYTDDPVSGNLLFSIINDKDRVNENLKFVINKKDWSNSSLIKVRLVPNNNVMKAMKLNITSPNYISVANVCLNIDEVSQNTNAPKYR